MALYRPPLLENSRKEFYTKPTLKDAVKGLKIDFFYNGERLGTDLISLTVCSLIEDNSDNLFLRLSTYSGLKEKWKEVIINQVKQQLQDLNVEAGFIRSETRFLEVTPEKHLDRDKFEKLFSNWNGQIRKKKDENNSV